LTHRPLTDRPDDSTSSRELLIQARAGNQEARERLWARYLPRLQRWAAGRLPRWARDIVDTDDLVQTTLLRSLNKFEGIEPRFDGALQAYLRQALLNQIRDLVRTAHVKPPVREIESQDKDAGPSPLEEAVGRQAAQRYEASLERLSAEDREAIVLKIEMGYAYPEVAEALDKPSVDAARMAVRRALLRLAKEMSREQ